MLRYVEGSKRNGTRPLRTTYCTCKVRLVSTWIKRRDVVTAARRIRNEEQREPQYMETFAWSFKIERVEWKEIRNAEQM